jgi:hypothetical protein
MPCTKGPVPYCLDVVSAQPNARPLLEKLRDEIEKLRKDDFRDLEAVFEKFLFEPANFGADKSSRARSFLQRHWFNEKSPEAYFPAFQPIAPVYATGVLKTLELSLSGRPNPIPIDAWWLMGYAGVEMINFFNNRQVTLLIVTTDPPVMDKSILGNHSEAWTTMRGLVTRRL